jgi:hypothetical protein
MQSFPTGEAIILHRHIHVISLIAGERGKDYE